MGAVEAPLLHREAGVASRVPIVAHVDAFVARTVQGDYVQTLRFGGASFECADDAALNQWHERLNVLWRNLASPHLAVWSHVVRRRDDRLPAAQPLQGFAADLDRRYRARLAGETVMVNELYVSLVYRPQPLAVGAATLQFLQRTDTTTARQALHDALDVCAQHRQDLMSALAFYEPEPLGLYVGPQGRLGSSLLEFHGLLVNGSWQPMDLPRGPLNEAVARVRPLFGQEAMEYRGLVDSCLGAMLGIAAHPTPTPPGLFNGLLTAPFPFVLTQSFTFIPKSTAVDLMKRQLRRLQASNDPAASQAADLKLALDDVVSNRFVLGDHHFTLQVLGDPFDSGEPAGDRIKALNDRLALARSLLGDTGMGVAREDLALEAAYWAQLPGHFALRPRKAPITSRNFAAMAPLHNFPLGRPSGNHWGDALTMFVTSARSPFFFSLHASDPRQPDGGSRQDVGHLAGIGPVGTGKTTVVGFLIAMLTGFGATQVVFDKDEGLHILVRALGGTYLTLRTGQPTGCNPLQLPETADHVAFLRGWLRRLVQRTPDEVLGVQQEEVLDQALRGTLSLPRGARRLSRVLEFLDTTDPEGLHARLRPWCASAGGELAWAFDQPADEVVHVLSNQALVGFDATDFLDHPQLRDPLSMYLFHLVHGLIDGRRVAVWADEFARILADRSFASFAKDGLEGWRKKNALLAAFTQSASHVLQSEIARAIVEQTPTKLFFPNPDADRAEYMDGFSLSAREFNLIKHELQPGSRQFLVKQNHASVVATLDLAGFDDELDVISGRTENVALMKELIARHGPQAAAWLPHFREAMRARRAARARPR